MAAEGNSGAAPATPWWKSKARLALGAAVLVAVVLVAVLVTTLSNNKQSKGSGGGSSAATGGLVTDESGGSADLSNVVNALLVANTPVDLPADLAEKQAAAAANGTTPTTTVTPVSGAGKEDDGSSGTPPDGDKAPATGLAGLTTRAWPALTQPGAAAGSNPTICYPKTGPEVVAASKAESKCTIIMLTNGGDKSYDITQQMNITTTKIFIGNPIDMPKLNATGKIIHRLFEVRAGGNLEIRAVRLYRAPPEILPTNFKLFAGGTVRVLLGGSANFYGCIFLLQTQTFQSFMRELDSPLSRYRIIGGHVLVLGGNVQLIGCQAFRWQPLGNPILNVVQIGREVAVIAGNCLTVGYFDAVGTLFLSAVNVGNLFAVLGGTGVLVGGGNINAAVANNQLGAGKNIFVGGGVMITVGYQNIGAFMLLLRSGFATHAVGAGVLIHIGHIHVRVWGVTGVFNAGQTHAVGAGIFEKLGGVLITDNMNFVFAGAGGNTFVGSGEAYWLGAPQTRCLLTSSNHGVGGIYFNGAGYTNVIGCPSASANLVRARYMLGGESFIGAGVVNYIHYKRFNTQLCDAWFGQGSLVFNGYGGVSLINSFSRNRRPCSYTTPNNAGVFVGGRRVGNLNRNQWITAEKVVVYSNKTNANKKLIPWFPPPKARRVQISTDATPAGFELPPPSLLMVQSSMEDVSRQVLEPSDFGVDEDAGSSVGSQNVLKGYHALVDFLQKQQQLGAQGEVASISASGDTKVSVPEGAECFLCNVGPLPTAERVASGQCQTSDTCTGANALEAIQAAAKEYAPKALPLDPTLSQLFGLDQNGRRLPEATATASPVNLPNSNLVWNELSIYCPTSAAAAADTSAAAAKCISDDLIKAAVTAYLRPMNGFSVAVAPQEVHAAVDDVAAGTKVVPEDLKEALMAPATSDQGCMTGTKYNVYVSTLDSANVKPIQEAFAKIEADPADFLQILHDAKAVAAADGDKAAAEGDNPCAVVLKPMTTVTFPPVEKMPAFSPRTLGMVGPSVTVGSADSIVPVSEAVKGKDYTLFLQNFPTGSAYEVRLMEGLDPVGTVIANVDAAEMGKDGVAEVKWAPPAGMETDPKTRYYLKASLKPFPAFFTVSQPFFIRDQATPGRRW